MAYLAAVAAFASGCAVSKKHVVPPGQVHPALEATKNQLLAQYNEQARAIHSLNATVNLIPTAGSTYSGVIEEYHDVNGFILAKRPEFIRVIGQAPVVAKDVFDMVSDGETFRIFIPSKRKFIVGSTAMTRPAGKPIENLRPQHLLDALFWLEIPAGATVLFEEWDAARDRYYILTVVRKDEIERKIWFNRADLGIARLMIYAPGGRLVSDIRYEDWQPVDTAGSARFPRHIWLARPHDDYQLEIHITKLLVNEAIPADRFQLAQPPGTELVRVGEGAEELQP
jgi:outer membrane lipoprotein-sorting protein